MEEKIWHALTEKEIFDELETTKNGLKSEDIESRLAKFGYNELVEEKRRTHLEIFLNQFKSFLVGILIVAFGISLVFKEWIDASVIFVIIIINAFLGYTQEYRAEKAIQALKKMTASKTIVIRDGVRREILSREVVPGDLIFFDEGRVIPADARLIESESLKVDESSLTGESLSVEKRMCNLTREVNLAEMCNMVFMGTHVSCGHGMAIVVETGMDTQFGNIAEMVQEAEDETTPLQVKLEKFGRDMSILILLICAFIFVLGWQKGLSSVFNMLLIAITLAIAAIPEGLPAIVTFNLALGMQEMAKNNALVRKLIAVETLGATTVICSDKTGTLTKNQMTITKIFVDNSFVNVTGDGYEPKGEFFKNNKKINPNSQKDLSLLLKIGSLCNNAHLEKRDGQTAILGDPTEGSILVLAGKAGMDYNKLKHSLKFLQELPFTTERKMMSVVYKDGGGPISYVKGAPEVIIDRCSHILENGKIKRMDQRKRLKLHETSKKMAEEPLRVLAIAYKPLSKVKKFSINVLETELIFVGIVGMLDPPRDGVKEAIETAKSAGIMTVMITGDHKVTAEAIARQIGILEKKGMVLTGLELDSMTQKELENVVEDVAVYARVSPEQKMRILEAFETKEHTVAMTGDGVNDAPALKRAHIGIAMGITGTDVAKEASDMILTDDHYSTIVNAVKRGRTIYNNISKCIRFELSANFGEISVVTLAALAGLPIPLNPLQLLWINIVTDTIPATALAVDPPETDIMERPPRKKEESIFAGGMLPFLVINSVLMCLIATWMFLWGMQWGIEKARTLVFTTLVVYQLILVFNCRSENKSLLQMDPFSNKYLVIGVIGSFALQLLAVYTPFMQTIFGTVSLDLFDWTVIVLFSLISTIISPRFFYKKPTT